MKVILVFDLPEERKDLEYALRGVDYSIVLDDLKNWLRNEYKYVEHTEEEYNIIEKVRNMINELSIERNLPE